MSLTTHADAVVIGAGPAGSALATLLAGAGHDVVVCEKAAFPRDKVCGDGLTPRAVKALHTLGLHDEAEGAVDGWGRQEGLRLYGGGIAMDLPWPEMDDYPSYSLTATRSLFDHTLARRAGEVGAQVWERTDVTGPVFLTSSQERVAGVTYTQTAPDGETTEGTVRAPLVCAADGSSSRLAVQLGLHRDTERPMGVAIRAYYESERDDLDMMEAFLELTKGDDLLPGYGWIFPLDDGTMNVGLGLLNTSSHFGKVNYRKALDGWVSGFPAEWGINADTMIGKPRSAGLPMGHNRRPPVHKGAMLVGDACGMINPFNGEGIGYGIEAAAFAAEAADEALRTRSDAPLASYQQAVAHAWGGYYTLGRMFVELIGHPEVMRLFTEFGMPRRTVLSFVFRMLAQLTNQKSRDATDRVINTLQRAVPVS